MTQKLKLDLQLVENILGKGESFLSQGRSKSGSLDKRFKKFKIDTAQRQALTTLRKRSFGKQREKKKEKVLVKPAFYPFLTMFSVIS